MHAQKKDKKKLFLSLVVELHVIFFNPYPRICLLILEGERRRKEEREREREKHQRERETLIGCLLNMPQSGIEPTTLGICPDQGSNSQTFGM